MTGLDKMINQIMEEANNSAGEVLQKAQAQAETMKSEALTETKRLTEEISRQSEVSVRNYRDRMKSSADLKRRTAVLAAKQELIAQTIDKAYAVFCNKTEEAYFKTIREMAAKFVLAQDGEIFFSSEDLARMPVGFESELQGIAAKKGGSLKLSKEGKAMKGGFILAYNGIEENCSFEALFNSKRDELQDKVQKVLFS